MRTINISLTTTALWSAYKRKLPAILYLLIVKGAYWIISNIAILILNFSLLLPLYRSANFAIAKLSLLIPLLQFLYKFCRLVHGFFSVLLPIHLSLFQLLRQRCRSFTLLKALAKSKSTHIAIAFKSEKEQ